MEGLSRRFNIAVLALFVGLVAVSLWLGLTRSIRRSLSVNSAPDQIAYCDLVSNPDRYDMKLIRVQGILIGYHELILYSPSCMDKNQITRAEFDIETRQQLTRAINSLNGAGFHKGNFWVQAVLTGQFEKITDERPNHKPDESSIPPIPRVAIHFRLNVLKVERVEAVPSDISWP